MSFGSLSCGYRQIPPQKIEISGVMRGLVAGLQCTMSYVNPLDRWSNISFTSPADNSLCIFNLQIKVNDSIISTSLETKRDAIEIANAAAKEGFEAACCVQHDQNYILEIANVAPQANIEISFQLGYTSTIQGNKIVFNLPLQVDNKNLGKVCQLFDFSLHMESPIPIIETISNCSGTMNDNTFVSNTPPSSSCLSIQFTLSEQPSAILVPGERHSAITIVPQAADTAPPSLPDENVFVIDCSGSMSGGEIEIAKECLNLFIHSLADGSLFNIVRFGTKFESLYPTSRPLNATTFAEAKKYTDRTDAILGGTRLLGPLQYIVAQPPQCGSRRVFVLTDGMVFDKPQVFDLVTAHVATNEVYSVGIGYGVDADLVMGIAKRGKGQFEFVRGCDDMRFKVMHLVRLSRSPKTQSIEVAVEGDESIKHAPIPSTVYGEAVTTFVETTGPAENALVTVDGVEHVAYKVSSIGEEYLHALYGLENIRLLETQLRSLRLEGKDDPSLVDQLVSLSKASNVVCMETGLVGIGQLVRDPETMRSDQIKMHVKILTGKHISLYPRLNDYVLDIKEELTRKEGIPIDQQRIMFAGTELENDRLLCDYNIDNDSTLHLVLRLRGGCSGHPVPGRTLPSRFGMEPLHDLVNLSSHDGHWDSAEAVQKLLELPAIPESLSKVNSAAVGTLLALAGLRKRFMDQEEAWYLIAEKALKWLAALDASFDWESAINELVAFV